MNIPSVSELARELGVNKSTVSRALRGDSQINKDTAARILKHAQVRGYQRNPALAALSDLRWRNKGSRALMNWGFVVTETAIRFAEHQQRPALFKEYAQQAGYSLSELVIIGKNHRPGAEPSGGSP